MSIVLESGMGILPMDCGTEVRLFFTVPRRLFADSRIMGWKPMPRLAWRSLTVLSVNLAP